MKNSTPAVIVCWILTFVINQSTVISGKSVLCVACSYTFAGDGTTDLECVTDVYNFSKTIVVNCTTGLCITRTVYSNEYKNVNSLHRSCSYSNSVTTTCDKSDSFSPTCEVTCSTTKCNDKNGDIWSSMKPEGGSGGVSLAYSVNYCTIISLLFLSLKYVA